MAQNPTIIVGHLNDKELKDSIDKLVEHVDKGTKQMVNSFNSSIDAMKAKLAELGQQKVDLGIKITGASTDGGTTKRTQKLKEEEVQAKATADAHKGISMTLDQEAIAMQKARRGNQMSVFEQYNMQIELLIARLKEVRQDIDIFNAAIGSGKKTQIEWGQQGLKQANEEAEKLMRIITTLENQRGNLANVIAPQGHTIQNYVNSLQKANPELAALNEQFKKGKSLMQNGGLEAHRMANAMTNSSRMSQQAIDALNAHLAKNIERERERREELLRTGKAAMETTDKIINEMHKQAQSESNLPISGIRELQEAFRQMRALYYSFSQDERVSPIGLALERDIERARVAIKWVQKYNMSLFGRDNQQQQFKITNDSTLDSLRTKLKTLTEQYNKLTVAEINAGKGDVIIENFQKITRAAQLLQNTLNRPINFSQIKNMQERNLDDISYKMQMLSRYRSGLDIDKQRDEINQVTQEYNRLKKKQDEVIGSNKNLENSNNALTRSFNYIKNRLAFYLTIGASTQFVKTIYDIRSQYELLERSIGILVDSLQQGTQIFSQLNAMALNSPFTTMELGAAAKQLVAYDIAAKDVVSTTKRIGDIAAAVGIPLERLTYALGQIKAYGYLNARDARMFSNAGIPLVKNLADRYTELEGRLVSVSDVYDRIKKKAISFEDVVDVIHKMTDEGGKFFDFQAKAADTMKVRLANLTLAYNNMLNQMGKEHQSLLTQPLVMLKELFENWRKVDNAILSVISTFGVLKVVQLLALARQGLLAKQIGWELLLGKKLTGMFITLGKTIATLAVNPFTWISIAIAALGYLWYSYRDLQNANEELNKSIKDNAQENINSINKFFSDYKEQLESIGGAGLVEQQKMWERIQDEIEKTTKNAQGYLKELNKIQDVSLRIQKGNKVLEQIQVINQEVENLAGHGYFNIGGGFMDDSMLTDLKQYEDRLNTIVKRYGSVQKALNETIYYDLDKGRPKTPDDVNDYNEALHEAEQELQNLIKTLDKANLGRIMGDSDDPKERLQHIREFANITRDNLLATEEGQKISIEGQALLNSYLDYWVAQKSRANKLISEEELAIERNRTAWETFFSQLNESERKRIDYMIATNQTGSKEFQNIWDDAAERMAKSATTSYNKIQDQIANLRATPDIVIRVVYQQTKENLDDEQQQFVDDFLTPDGESVRTIDGYFKEKEKLTKKYGRFQKKQSEDNVEWEKRLGDTYRDNEEKIKKLTKQLSQHHNKENDYYKAQANELKMLQQDQEALLEIQAKTGFDYSKENKNKANAQKKTEDEIANALQKEIQLINEMRSNYDKLRKSGVSNMDAINLASQGYEDTILRINNILGKYGIDKFNASNFTGKDVRTLLNNLESQRKTLLASGKVKLASLQSLDVEIKKLSIDAKTYDMKKITDGLNNELGKLKEEYELAVELEANPELGDMFTDMLGIDVSELPRTFEQIFSRANKIAQKHLDELGVKMSDFDLLSTQIKGDETNRWMGLDIDSEPIKALLKMQKTYQDMFKKNLIDTEKDLDDYVKKYGSYADKVAEIESNRLQRIERLNNAYYTEEMRRRPEYWAKLAAIDEGANKEIGQVDFDEFKNSRYYTMMFENLDYVSTRAIRSMRDKLSELMTTMNNLTPEQLKTLMQQYEKLEQTLVKRNPFKTLTKDVKQYIKTTSDRRLANKSFRDVQNEYDAQKKVVSELKVKKENMIRNQAVSKQQIEEIDVEILKQEDVLRVLREQLEAAEKKADKYNLIKKLAIEESQQVVQMVNANVQSLGQLRDFIQDDLGVALGDELNGFIDGMGKASDGVNNILSSAQSGNVVGTVLGVGQAITGVLDGVASIFGDGAARTKRLNREIAQSEEIVRQLNMAYKDLERTVDSAMGAEELRARRSEISNKKAQLTELERQRTLEQQKRSKDRDDEKIKQYDEAIQDLRNEIDDITSDITSTLLGSGIKDAAESFVDTWVSAWRQGEDTMDALGEKFDNMIDTMIAKSLASRLVSKRIQGIWDAVDTATDETSLGGAEITMDELQRLRALIGDKSIAERINDDLTNLYNALGIAYGVNSTSEKNLSNLQQGIQGITEDTAGALEAYMNGVSQQVYLQSDLLTQIRDTVAGFDIDIQTSTISQMLLQLQQSYAVQMAIQNILNGALNPSGRAFMVELNS